MNLSVRTNALRYKRICEAFEGKYKMTLEKFLEQFEAGKLGDEQEYFDWYAATRGLKLWQERDGVHTEHQERQ